MDIYLNFIITIAFPFLVLFFLPRINAAIHEWACGREPRDFNYYELSRLWWNYMNIVTAYYCKLPDKIFRRVWFKITLLRVFLIFIPLFAFFTEVPFLFNAWFPFAYGIWLFVISWILLFWSLETLDRVYEMQKDNSANTYAHDR